MPETYTFSACPISNAYLWFHTFSYILANDYLKPHSQKVGACAVKLGEVCRCSAVNSTEVKRRSSVQRQTDKQRSLGSVP